MRWNDDCWEWRLLNSTGVVLDHGDKLVGVKRTPTMAMRALVRFLLLALTGDVDEFSPSALRWAEHNHQALRRALRDLRASDW